MTYATLIYQTAEGLAEIRLNRPERLNALGRQSYDELQDALGAAEADAAVRAVLLTGEGRAFSVGADLKEQLNAERSFEAALTAEQEAMALCAATEDWQEGLAAFAARRPPVFRGR